MATITTAALVFLCVLLSMLSTVPNCVQFFLQYDLLIQVAGGCSRCASIELVGLVHVISPPFDVGCAGFPGGIGILVCRPYLRRESRRGSASIVGEGSCVCPVRRSGGQRDVEKVWGVQFRHEPLRVSSGLVRVFRAWFHDAAVLQNLKSALK